MLASQVQSALQRAFTFIKFVEIGMFRCGLLGRCQSAIEVVKLELMLVAILLGLGDFPIQLLELTGERCDAICGGFQRFLRLLGFEPGFGAFGGFLVDESSRFIAFGFGLGHLLSHSAVLGGQLFDLCQCLVSACGQRQVRLRDGRAADRRHAVCEGLAVLGDGPHGFAECHNLLGFVGGAGHGYISQQETHGAHDSFGLCRVLGIRVRGDECRQRVARSRGGPRVLGATLLRLRARLCGGIAGNARGQHHGFAELIFPSAFEGVQHVACRGYHDGAGILVERVGHGFFPAFGHMDEVGESAKRGHVRIALQRSGGIAAV